MRRYALRDDQWERIKDLLPGREGSVGVTAADNRLFVEAVLYRFRAGMPWRDLPERFGDGVAVHRRFSRWAKSGVWQRVFEHLAADARRITAERLHERLSVPNAHDEIGRLAAVINETFARLESSFDQLRRFTADASHGETACPRTAG